MLLTEFQRKTAGRPSAKEKDLGMDDSKAYISD